MKNAKFKDSGVQWLGEIPSHWEVVPIRAIYSESDKRCGNANFELLSVTIEKGIIKQSEVESKQDISNDDKSKYKIVPLNAVAYNKMRMWQGAVGMNEICDGIVSPAYIVVYPRQNFCNKFMSYLFRANFMLMPYNKYSYGICQDQNTLRIDDFKNIKIPLPPLDEQRRIAEFLDSKCAKIAEFIDKKQQIISLLKEQKLALINESTCGRIPNFLYKSDSTKNPLSCEAQSKSLLPCEVESKLSPLPCGGGLGVGIKTSKFGKDFTPPLAPPARGGEQKSGYLASGKEYVGLPRTSGGEQEVSHRPLAPYMKDFSRAMRKNPTQAENKLWQELRGKKLGFGFRRQFVIDSKYIADFVCLEKRLIIECDGGQHNKYELPHPKSLCYGEGLETSESLTQAEGLAHKAQSKSPLPCKAESKLSPLPQHEGHLGVGKNILNHPDIQRDFYLESQNFRILRFWNNEILGNLEGVLCVIKEALESNADFANVKSTCESTHPLAPSAREGECVESPHAREGERESNPHTFKFKHSGIEWLGEIPNHWEVRKLKQIANFDKGLNITKENLRDNGIFVLSYGEIHSKYPFEVNPQIHQLKCVGENYLTTNLNSLLRKGDFVFADTSEDIIGSGNFSFLNSEIPTFAGYHTIICRIQNLDCHESANADSRNDKHSTPSLRVSEANAAIHKISAKFLAYEFESSIFRSQIQKNVNGVKVYSITQNILKDCAVWLPPLDEQKQIAEFLDKKCAKIDKAIALIEQEIQAIKEYKTSLIDKAVRGQI